MVSNFGDFNFDRPPAGAERIELERWSAGIIVFRRDMGCAPCIARLVRDPEARRCSGMAAAQGPGPPGIASALSGVEP
jgi:hypothetical protein